VTTTNEEDHGHSSNNEGENEGEDEEEEAEGVPLMRRVGFASCLALGARAYLRLRLHDKVRGQSRWVVVLVMTTMMVAQHALACLFI
jgi:hypothetical protein